MNADLYAIITYDGDVYDDYSSEYVQIIKSIMYTSEPEVVQLMEGKAEIRKYTDFTHLKNPCSMDYYNKMKAEKNRLIDEMQKEIEEKDRRIYELNKRIIEMTKE